MNYRKWFVRVPVVVIVLPFAFLFHVARNVVEFWHFKVSQKVLGFFRQSEKTLVKVSDKLNRWSQ